MESRSFVRLLTEGIVRERLRPAQEQNRKLPLSSLRSKVRLPDGVMLSKPNIVKLAEELLDGAQAITASVPNSGSASRASPVTSMRSMACSRVRALVIKRQAAS